MSERWALSDRNVVAEHVDDDGTRRAVAAWDDGSFSLYALQRVGLDELVTCMGGFDSIEDALNYDLPEMEPFDD